ncbi:MAG: hypothetical protein A2033_17160 [Bacteroidetes bacterium GWA2_31_9]|nr:MAG: hypothetical protein A2033_17160 [Bacteroidetes bacterium GWA2_31_9]
MTDNNYDKLFELFPTSSIDDWEKVVNEDLKGGDFEKKLVWNTSEGFKVLPCYHNSKLTNYKPDELTPAIFPFLRATKTTNDWKICQDIVVKDPKEANKIASKSIKSGADAIHFIIKSKISKNEVLDLLKNLDFNADLYFTAPSHEVVIAEVFSQNAKLKGSINFDPLGYLSTKGNYLNSEKDYSQTFKKLHNLSNTANLDLKILNINGSIFHNSGATIVQEVGLSLSKAVEYINKFTDVGFKPEEIFKSMKFTFSIGNNYFFEIAKLRAARFLWAKIASSYNINDEFAKMQIHSETSVWNMTKYDPHVNMLRATTEAMSAIIGGTDSLTIKPFDITYKSQNDFSDRVAKNIQNVLRHESSLDKVTDVAAGSYYIENLTNSIIEQAWKIFLQIEETGGYLKSFEKGIVQKIIKETSAKRELEIALKNEKILGTNLYPNILESISKNDEKPEIYPHSDEKKIIEPLKLYRGAEAFEELRLKTEKLKKTPEVFLLTYGNPAMRKARATFSSGFFSCAGFKIIDNIGFKTIDEGIKEAKSSKAEITVICSFDDEYPEIVPQLIEKLNNSTILILAGYPKNHVEEFQKLGLKNFIHAKSNILETLIEIQNQLGI